MQTFNSVFNIHAQFQISRLKQKHFCQTLHSKFKYANEMYIRILQN
jgi:hypothetical protein